MDHTSRKNGPEKRKGVEQNEILRQITEKLADIHSRGEVHGKTPSTHELDLEGKWDVSNESLNEWRPAEETQSDDSLKPTQEGDIFSLGCYFYYVITGGQHPFGRSGQRALFIANNLYHLAGCKDPHLQKLIAKMINCDWAKRPKSTELLKHPYLWTSERTEEYLMEVAKNTYENGDQYEKWKGTILLSEKSAGGNGIRKKTTKVTNVAAVLREIKENKENPSDLCKMFPNLLFSVLCISENTESEIEDKIDESRPETFNELLIGNGRYGEVESVVEIKRRHGRLGLQHVHVIQFPKGDDDTTTKAERLRYLSHENCLQCFYLVTSSSEIFMAFEPFNETLATWLIKKREVKQLECEIIHDILRQITKGLVYYHSNKLKHGNLSLSQIVIFEKGTTFIVAKVASFSLSQVKCSPETSADSMRTDIRELGQIFSYLLSESQQEVSQSHVHLIRAMKELTLPSAATVLKHPLLWSLETTTAFLLTASDYYVQHPDFDKTSKLEIAVSAPLNPNQQNWKTNREAMQAFSAEISTSTAKDPSAGQTMVTNWIKIFPKLVIHTWLRLQKFKNVSAEDDLDLDSFYHPNYDFPPYDELIDDEKYAIDNNQAKTTKQNLEFCSFDQQVPKEIIQQCLNDYMKHQTKESNKDQESTSSSTVKHPHIDSFGRTAIHIACQSDDFYESLSALMDHGFDPNIKDFNGHAPLHVAAEKNAIKAAKLLIKKKAEIDKPDSLGRNPLHFAVANNSLGVAEVLLENKANVNAKDSFGNSSLHIAVAKNLIEMVKLLLKYNVNPNASLHTGLDGRIGCVLHLAVVKLFCEMVEFLLSAGANPNQTNRFGETALHLTALLHPFHTTSLTIVDQLINKNANPNITDQFGRTPLYAATLNKNEDVVKMLLNCSTDIIDQSDKLEGMTPLHLAALHKSENMTVLLIEKGAHVNVEDKNGLTPLDYAAASNASIVAKHLLESTVDKAKFLNRAKYIRSPLHIAAAHDSVEVGDLLISNGANINSVDKLRLTPLHYATFRKKERFVKFLLDKQENTLKASSHQQGKPYQPKNRHQPSLKQQKMYLSKNLSPDELASVPQLINCEIPTIIQINLRPPTVAESVNQLAFTVRGGAGLAAGPSWSFL